MSTKPLKLMYVDDDADDRFLFESATEVINHGLTVSTLNNGDTALLHLEENNFSYDLLFLDLNMPVKSGYDVLDELQDVIKKKHLKIVIFTTSGNQASIEATYKLNATLFVQKPDSFEELVNTIRSIVAMHGNLRLPVSYDEFKFSRSYA